MATDYTIKPAGSLLNYTVVTLTHHTFGVEILYIPDVEFETIIKSIIKDAWINGYTFIIHPGS